MTPTRITHIKYDQWKIPTDYPSIEFFEAYAWLFRFENALRLLVYAVLKAHKGKDWSNTAIDPSDPARTILSISRQRRAQLEKFGHVGGAISLVPIMYLGLGELSEIILHPTNRRYFAPFFSASLEEAYKTKLGELTVTRNNLAHFRRVVPLDLDRMTNVFADLGQDVTGFLTHLTDSDGSSGYPQKKDKRRFAKAWATFRSERPTYVSTSISESVCSNWISIGLSFATVLLDSTWHAKTALVDAARISEGSFETLATNAELRSEVIFLRRAYSLRTTYKSKAKHGDVLGNRTIVFRVFRPRFEDGYARILRQLRRLLLPIESEYAKLLDNPGATFDCIELRKARVNVLTKEGEDDPYIASEWSTPSQDRRFPEDWTSVWGQLRWLADSRFPWIDMELGCGEPDPADDPGF